MLLSKFLTLPIGLLIPLNPPFQGGLLSAVLYYNAKRCMRSHFLITAYFVLLLLPNRKGVRLYIKYQS